jgi:EmrB/QacA subfamily drug resistance transporter
VTPVLGPTTVQVRSDVPSVRKNLVLAAMVFAVATMFIDQTIVAIAIPDVQKDLGLSATGSQWVINGYLLALSATFALGGKLGDVLGRRRMVVVGVIGFGVASAFCGFTPTGGVAQAWIITFRFLQGVAAALLLPAAIAIVMGSFEVGERGKAMAIFSAVTGAVTALGPIAGGFLTQWTWRSIFWINIPICVISLILIHRAKPEDARTPGKLDYVGSALIIGAIGLIVLGLQQSGVWGWGNPATWGTIAGGGVLGVGFVAWELREKEPLLRLRVFRDRGFSANNVILALMSVVFVPFFFFASVYSQAALGLSASETGLYMFYFFIGFIITAQIGGRVLDARGAKPAVLVGAALGAVGFYLLSTRLTHLSLSAQWYYIVLAGGGLGLILGPANTDAINRAPRNTYGEVSGIVQTSRNVGASVGLAVLGALLIVQNRIHVTAALIKGGVSPPAARHLAGSLLSSSSSGSGGAGPSKAVLHNVQLAVAYSTQDVFHVMAAVLAATFVVAVVWLPWGRADAQDGASAP